MKQQTAGAQTCLPQVVDTHVSQGSERSNSVKELSVFREQRSRKSEERGENKAVNEEVRLEQLAWALQNNAA